MYIPQKVSPTSLVHVVYTRWSLDGPTRHTRIEQPLLRHVFYSRRTAESPLPVKQQLLTICYGLRSTGDPRLDNCFFADPNYAREGREASEGGRGEGEREREGGREVGREGVREGGREGGREVGRGGREGG